MPKVLVIDDNEMVRTTISRILTRNGFEIVIAEDGAQGLTMFRRERPDVVITDLIMPEKEGIETMREIRQEHADAKIIAISGGGRIGDTDLLTLVKKLGATAVIPKPRARTRRNPQFAAFSKSMGSIEPTRAKPPCPSGRKTMAPPSFFGQMPAAS
jgi:CheY-like chemotaxis protein